jgi:hypothetical protein
MPFNLNVQKMFQYAIHLPTGAARLRRPDGHARTLVPVLQLKDRNILLLWDGADPHVYTRQQR